MYLNNSDILLFLHPQYTKQILFLYAGPIAQLVRAPDS